MIETKLVQLLQSLPKPARKRFISFLESPYFNQRQDLIDLARVLEKRVLQTKKEKSEEEVWARVYPDEVWNQHRFTNLKTALKNKLLQFITQQGFESRPEAHSRFLLEQFNAWGELQHFPFFYKKAVSALARPGVLESDLLAERAALAESYNEYIRRTGGKAREDHFPQQMEALSDSFLIRIYHGIIEDLDRQAIHGQALDWSLGTQIVAFVGENFRSMHKVVQGYHFLYLLRTLAAPESSYQRFRAFLENNATDLSRAEALNLYIGLLNFAARRLNNGALSYLRDIFEIYREMLEKGLLLHKDKISARQFKNVVNVALRCQEHEWAESFFSTYSVKILNDPKGSVTTFCEALLHFHASRFDRAEAGFYRVIQDYSDIFFALDARSYLLQIFYENGDMRALESGAHSFRMFLDRNKDLSTAQKRQYIDFILHLRRLCNVPPFNHKRLQKLKQDIQTKAQKGMGSSWLLEKIEGMEKG